MVKKIYKFPIDLVDSQVVTMQAGAKVLACQMQGSMLCLWAMVDPAADVKACKVLIYGTGHEIESHVIDGFSYVGTVQESVFFVWHVFIREV